MSTEGCCDQQHVPKNGKSGGAVSGIAFEEVEEI
jgi:hypothetical protein